MGNVSNIYRRVLACGDTRGINLTWTRRRQKQESGGACGRSEGEEEKAAETSPDLGIPRILRWLPAEASMPPPASACAWPAFQLACVFLP